MNKLKWKVGKYYKTETFREFDFIPHHTNSKTYINPHLHICDCTHPIHLKDNKIPIQYTNSKISEYINNKIHFMSTWIECIIKYTTAMRFQDLISSTFKQTIKFQWKYHSEYWWYIIKKSDTFIQYQNSRGFNSLHKIAYQKRNEKITPIDTLNMTLKTLDTENFISLASTMLSEPSNMWLRATKNIIKGRATNLLQNTNQIGIKLIR